MRHHHHYHCARRVDERGIDAALVLHLRLSKSRARRGPANDGRDREFPPPPIGGGPSLNRKQDSSVRTSGKMLPRGIQSSL